jgi:hypothetical protein
VIETRPGLVFLKPIGTDLLVRPIFGNARIARDENFKRTRRTNSVQQSQRDCVI